MTFKSILLHFAVYCILRGNSETIPEIAYEVQNLHHEVLLLPLNNVPVKTNERAKYDKFVLIEGSEARIAVYGESIYKIHGISVEVIPENWHLSTERVLSAKENSYVCYVKFQIHQIYSSMRREWEITFSFNGYGDISKKIAVHVRPSEVSNGLSVSVKPNKLITTQIASHAIKDFDAFGCLVYKDQDDLEMRCKQSISNTILMEWSPSFEDKDSVKKNGKEAAIYSNRLKLIHNGNYTDCIEHMIRDTIIVRIFLVLSTTKSWPNDNSVKPISSDDRDGCAKYVSCLYGSGVLKQNDYCVKPTDTEPGKSVVVFTILVPITAWFVNQEETYIHI
ncbi:hypothetical protein K1T71_009435 [Dendrolimus kikuchii]|uniref:Uncharacterized protein n=1 Tax=Dendrolimus kikuchii TaxID=765133 RepID=A0ACC1CUE4_9NEOP|nr:hypothetical protein K1T71_009435 [Dendrolimus kikuchii]